ncbi:DUF6494 family protein [Methylobacterium nodulans]|uniref:Uncharacterized protein n=1 Tax=Methylobacterium nodulans (strain LMG 21967 / CNCM I-2342 / ORS 2060) TaxID=460265 RepID=B8IFE3_METNO|nr:DUF6494 family protein [Methylobacterium nodulans]ACL57678.1 conserved hypothetical protein [Methylobacterium nodulans ORS 2060]
MDEDRFNIELRKFLKEVGVTSQREIERVARDGLVSGNTLKLRMTLTAENAPLQHTVERTIALEGDADPNP